MLVFRGLHQRGDLSEPLLGQGRSVPFRTGPLGAETGANDRCTRLNGGDGYVAVSGTQEVDRSRQAHADSEAASWWALSALGRLGRLRGGRTQGGHMQWLTTGLIRGQRKTGRSWSG